MPFYKELRLIDDIKEKERICNKILELRKGLSDDLPVKTVHDTLLIASWNIREFAESNKGGTRLDESYYYIAEIISKFDIIAVQEVRDDLSALKRLMKILGYGWTYIATDTVLGTSGNSERLAFIYDTSKVTFRGIAGEIVLSDKSLVTKQQFARTPFTVYFQSGWFKFVITTVHIFYGTDSGAKLQRRIDEIAKIVSTLDERIKKDEENTYIVLGDFNIISPEHKTMQALKSKNFIIPANLEKIPSNFKEDKHYDQIAFKTNKGKLEFTNSKNCSGVFKYYKYVFKENEDDIYYPLIKAKGKVNKAKAYAEWKTYQMSDHLPMFVEVKIDFSNYYLENLPKEHKP